MEEYEPWMSKPEDENVVVEIKSATFGWNEVIYIYVYYYIGARAIKIRDVDAFSPEGSGGMLPHVKFQ